MVLVAGEAAVDETLLHLDVGPAGLRQGEGIHLAVRVIPSTVFGHVVRSRQGAEAPGQEREEHEAQEGDELVVHGFLFTPVVRVRPTRG